MKIKQVFKTEHFANSFVDSLKKDKNIIADVKKMDNGLEVSYEVKAYAETESPEKEDVREMIYSAMDYMYEEISYRMSFVYQEIDALYDWVSRHSEGHLPKANGVEQMTRAVKNLGLDEEYEVAKKTIWASTDGTIIDSIKIDE